jgi:hypothetical protein
LSATLVHPAAILPFYYAARKYLPLSALVIGSLAPDFEYLLRWGAGNRFAHTLPGMAFCLPAGLVALFLFHMFLKRPIIEILPAALRRRLLPLAGEFSWLPWTRPPLILLAVAVGALTHLAWDTFTHSGSWGTQIFPGLQTVIYASGRFQVRVYSLLQYLLTPLGFGVLAGCFWFWMRRTASRPEPPPPVLGRRACLAVWAGLVLVPLALGLAVGLTAMGPHRGAFGLRQLIAGTALGAHAGLYAAVLAYGVGFTLWQWRRTAERNRISA